ncbi:MAG: TonB-dependent receptor [Saprospiraceae bacterium]
MQQQTLIFILFWTLFTGFLHAQTATLTGKVTDQTSGEPLIAATILAGAKGAVADAEGIYTVILEPGTYKVEISYVGYQPLQQTITLADGETKTLDAALSSETNVLQTATVTSGKYQKPLSEVTVSLEVLKPNLIENTSKLTIDKALDKVPGVSVIDGQANIRGGSGYAYGAGSRVLLLVDDIPILQADAGFPNWDDVPIENIEQVEVLKGAASSLFGSSALNGIVNIRTAVPKSEPETKLAVFYNPYFAPRDEQLKWWDSAPYSAGASLSHRQRFKKLDLVLGGFYLNEESFNKDTFKKFGRFNFTTNYRITDRLTVGLNGNFNKGESGSFFFWKSDVNAYEPPTDSAATTRKRFRYNLDPHITYFDNAGNRHKFLGRYYDVNNDNSANQSNFSTILYGEYQFQRRFVNADLVITAGAVGMRTKVEAELYGDTTFTSGNLAAYLQLEKKFGERLNISAGFRLENNVLNNPGFQYRTGNTINTITPSEERETKPVMRLGVNYKVTDYTYLRASWGQGYRYPTIAEKYIYTDAGGFFVVPSPDLGSETGWTAEVAVKQGFKIGNFEGFVDLAAFQMNFNNMIEFNPFFGGFSIIPNFRAVDVGDTEIKGGEISIAGRGKLFGDWQFGLLTGYVYTEPRYLEYDAKAEVGSKAYNNYNNSSLKTDNILKYRPRHSFKADLEITKGAFSFGVESFHNSHVEAVDAIFLLIINGLIKFREADDNGYWLNNVRTSYTFANNLKFSLLLNNIFNEAYSVRPGLLEAPRNMTFRIDYKF